ncbi:ATP-binding cassette domain-containing protein [Methanosphaera sp. WGK6]|uniref:ATP-binding cassette domain-containing protein n=1 Tax=Methanosphaera sp. WGK6 TaxID=1561964 RepID=UPI00084C5843|nr:ATP-binding cassette domain-containing protein [Methanosphaera sp. WGK6]OED30035.1 ABC transporter ATP-binding protein [Methanosphaera sp. WGK6]
MIKVENLTKIYKLNNNNRIKALDNVSFEINDGEIFGIMGVSGSGKSTLMRILRGVEEFDEGTITVDDIVITPENYSEYKNDLKDKTAIHLQRSFGLWSETAIENVIHKLVGIKTGDETTTDINEVKDDYYDEALDILDTVGLKEKADHFAPVLSGGEKQRLVLARQLAKKPEILLLDEPATMSSPKKRLEILKTIKRINEKYNTTVIVVSHQPEIQKFLCSRTMLLFNGKVEEVNDTETIIDKFLSNEESIYPIADMDRSEPIIKVRNLTKDFYLYKGGHVLTINDINFDVNKGEILSIIGPTGSGKTEILRMIAGFEQPDSGSIEILTNDTWTKMDEYGENRMNIRKNMGFMHQEFALTPHTPILEQIGSKLSPKMDNVYEKALKKADELGLSKESLDIIYQLTDLSRNDAILKLQKVNLGPEVLELLFPTIEQDEIINYSKPVFEALDLPLPLLSRQFIELSGGQKVRVAIATVLASNPDILILDEPFGDLDPVTLRIVANSLKKINEELGTTIILVSHTMEFVKEVSTRCILINKGELVAEGDPEIVTNKFIESEDIE